MAFNRLMKTALQFK